MSGTQLEQQVSLSDHSMSGRCLRAGLTGTVRQVQDRIGEFDKRMPIFSVAIPSQLEKMERFADEIIQAQPELA